MIYDALGGEREIALGTRLDNAVPNFQASALPAGIAARDAALRRNHPAVRYRLGPSGFYNCHGMVFACRRSAIEDPSEVRKILADDDYVEVVRESVLPGDVVIYYAAEDADPEHSAVVIEPPTAERLWIPLVYSKWAAFSEAIHLANDCPYSFVAPRYYRVRR